MWKDKDGAPAAGVAYIYQMPPLVLEAHKWGSGKSLVDRVGTSRVYCGTWSKAHSIDGVVVRSLISMRTWRASFRVIVCRKA